MFTTQMYPIAKLRPVLNFLYAIAVLRKKKPKPREKPRKSEKHHVEILVLNKKKDI